MKKVLKKIAGFLLVVYLLWGGLYSLFFSLTNMGNTAIAKDANVSNLIWRFEAAGQPVRTMFLSGKYKTAGLSIQGSKHKPGGGIYYAAGEGSEKEVQEELRVFLKDNPLEKDEKILRKLIQRNGYSFLVIQMVSVNASGRFIKASPERFNKFVATVNEFERRKSYFTWHPFTESRILMYNIGGGLPDYINGLRSDLRETGIYYGFFVYVVFYGSILFVFLFAFIFQYIYLYVAAFTPWPLFYITMFIPSSFFFYLAYLLIGKKRKA